MRRGRQRTYVDIYLWTSLDLDLSRYLDYISSLNSRVLILYPVPSCSIHTISIYIVHMSM